MQPNQANFSCQACGYAFSAPPDFIAQQPTCPKCRTFGKLVASSPAAQRTGARPPAPRRAPTPYRPAQQPSNEAPVEVSAAAVYGPRKSTKSTINMVILIIVGIGIVGVLYFIVTTLKDDRAEHTRQMKEEVLDKKEFERAIEEQIGKVRSLLATVPSAEVEETPDFTDSMNAIRSNGGATPSWNEAYRPGTPFKSYSFQVRARDQATGKMTIGFVTLLYYTTAQQAEQAEQQLNNELGRRTSHISTYPDKSMWFLAYSGCNYGGVLYEALKRSMAQGKPSGFKQFRNRVGAE
jgi:hypothetical protein